MTQAVHHEPSAGRVPTTCVRAHKDAKKIKRKKRSKENLKIYLR